MKQMVGELNSYFKKRKKYKGKQTEKKKNEKKFYGVLKTR